MGAGDSKEAGSEEKALKKLPPPERQKVEDAFAKLAGSKHTFTKDDLKREHAELPEEFCDVFCQLARGGSEKNTVTKAGFLVTLNALRSGYHSETAKLLTQFFKQFKLREEAFARLLKSLLAFKNLAGPWVTHLHPLNPTTIASLANAVTQDLHSTDTEHVEKWLTACPLAIGIIQLLVSVAFDLPPLGDAAWVPDCVADTRKTFETVLSLPGLLYLNAHLPSAAREEWRLLFHSGIEGESFSRLQSAVNGKGPCILLIKDWAGDIFGGFASQGFTLGPSFTGDTRTFLFTLRPRLCLFPATGYNSNFTYLNLHQETMANGLGFGGIEMGAERLENFALWLSPEFGVGKSEAKSSTFHNDCLSASGKSFKYTSLEVWAVGKEPVKDTSLEDEGGRSILDKATPDTKAVLEMMGKKCHSDGLREPEKE